MAKPRAGDRLVFFVVVCAQLLALYFFTKGFLLTRFETSESSKCHQPPGFPANPPSSTSGSEGVAGHTNTSGTKIVPSEADFSADEPVTSNKAEPSGNGKESCWFPKRFKRAVIILVDALRYDFVAWDAEFTTHRNVEEETQPLHKASSDPEKGYDPRRFYLNHVPVIRETLAKDRLRARKKRNEGRYSLLYRFEADPPTVTMQRLKGLMTGGMPTFIDFKDNFGTSDEVTVDNMLRQLVTNKRRIVFMGDDTWTDLFPPFKYFHRSFPFPSFNVKDLDTVDRGVTSYLLPLLEEGFIPPRTNSEGEGSVPSIPTPYQKQQQQQQQQQQKKKKKKKKKVVEDWDVIIAHYLGIDHTGHTFSPRHPSMSRKLGELDQVLRRVFAAADKDTLVVVFGDHGMTEDGNHGGSSSQEKMSALFLYSHPDRSVPLIEPPQVGVDLNKYWQLQEESVLTSFGLDNTQDVHQGPRTVAQIDILPTLCLLLGVPIPFENLGKILPELFYHHDNTAGGRDYEGGGGGGLGGDTLTGTSLLSASKHQNQNSSSRSSVTDERNFLCNDILKSVRLGAVLRINALQIQRYITVYGTSAKLASSAVSLHVEEQSRLLGKVLEEFEIASLNANDLCLNGAKSLYERPQMSNHTRLQEVLKDLQRLNSLISRFIDDIYRACRRQWTQFDLPSMAVGIIWTAFSLILSLWHLKLFEASWPRCFRSRGAKFENTLEWQTQPLNLLILVCVFFLWASHFSNSYIEAEAEIISFVASTICAALAFFLLQKSEFSRDSTQTKQLSDGSKSTLKFVITDSPALFAVAAMACIRLSLSNSASIINSPVTLLSSAVPLFGIVFMWAWVLR